MKLFHCFDHLHSSPRVEERGKQSIDGARSNRSPAAARLHKLVYIVNIDHGLFNRTKKEQNKRSVSQKNNLPVR